MHTKNNTQNGFPVTQFSGIMAPYDEFENAHRSEAGEALEEIHQEGATSIIITQLFNFLEAILPYPIFYQDKWGRFLGCNKNFEELVNKNKGEIIGRHGDEFLPQPIGAVMRKHFSSIRERGTIYAFEFEIQSEEKFGQRLMISYVGLGTESVEMVVGSITEITPAHGGVWRPTLGIHRNEKEQLAIQAERLQSELECRNRELTLHLELLIHSKNVKEKWIEGINKLQPYLTLEGKSKLFSTVKQFQWQLNAEKDLNFERKFDEVNGGLYAILEKICPEITKNEKRLCAYLKMNHGSSDIAKITDKSLNSVNVGFARLRAKLGLPNNKDLRSYLHELQYQHDPTG